MDKRKINYRSDFDFVLDLKTCDGSEIGFPDYDFKIFLYTANRASGITASCINGKCTNLFNDNGKIHIVCDSHSLGVGELKMDFTAYLPDALFPDGDKRIVTPTDLGITLVVGEGDCAPLSEVEYIVPYIYVSAFELAKNAGYEGTLEEYTRALNDMVEIVEEAKNVKALMADWADGKRVLSDALRKWDVDSQPTDSFIKMRDDIMNLPVRGENEEGVLPQTYCGAMPFDLLQVLNNNRRAEYPYMFGVQFAAFDESHTIALTGADAYLTSDGEFYTEECEHTFSNFDEANSFYVIYYFKYPEYTVFLPSKPSRFQRIVAFGGMPRFNVQGTQFVYSLESYTDERYRIDEAAALTITGYVYKAFISGVIGVNQAALTCNNYIQQIEMPHLEEFDFSSFTESTAVGRLIFPSLKKVIRGTFYNNNNCKVSQIINKSVESIEYVVGNNFANNVSSIIRMEMESLKSITGSGIMCYNLTNLTDVTLPALESISGGTLFSSCSSLTDVTLPALESISGDKILLNASSAPNLKSISLPAVKNIEFVANNTPLIEAPDTLENLDLINLKICRLGGYGSRLFSKLKKIKEVAFDNLETLTSGVLLYDCQNIEHISLNKLESITSNHSIVGGSFFSQKPLIIDMPSLNSTPASNSPQFYESTSVMPEGFYVQVNFGAPQDGYIYFRSQYADASKHVKRITVQPGFRSYLNISGFTNIEKECLENIIHNLADNNFYATLQIVFGATNLAKLSDEIKLEATNKNYTLS